MTRCIAFDFERKRDEEITLEATPHAMAQGRFVWVDGVLPPASNKGDIERLLAPHLPLSPDALELMDRSKPDTGYEHLHDALHISVAASAWDGHHLSAVRVDILKTPGFLLTLARGEADFLRTVRRDYREDFERFARTPGFLLYEMFDHLTRSYETIEHRFEEEVERLQLRLAQRPSGAVFPVAARLAANIVRLRRHVAPARAIAAELGTRRSAMIPETTQPFLVSTAAELERVLTDLTVSREILNDAVNLTMSYLAYRTNNLINLLTVVSFIFLPLTFLVGVYGMNFEHQPEFKWPHGYAYFWALCAIVTVTIGLILLALLRRERAALRRSALR
ncbi:MAG: magnesium transporter CorA family protein [Phycisphaerales bacterium]